MKTGTHTTTSAPVSIAEAQSTAGPLSWPSRHPFIFGALLVALTFLIYQPAWNGQLLLDDKDHMVNTPQLRSLHGLSDLWFAPRTTRQYHPLLDTVYWIEDKLWGQSMPGYHLLSILFHSTSALLLFTILRRIKMPGAWLAAGIFALHPVQVESVAWMVELKNTLSGFFFFASILVYLRFDEKRKAKLYIATLLLFTMGILVKAVVAAFPAVVLLILWWQRGKLEWKRDVRPLLPFLVLGAAAGIVTAWMERALAGAEGEDFDFSSLDRVLIAGRAFWFYLGKVFWPANLTLIYPRWKVDSSVWWQYLFPLGALCLFVWSWVLRRHCRWFIASLLFFALMTGPFLGFFNIAFFRFSLVADHFEYLPSLGVIVPLAAGAGLLIDQFGRRQRLIGYGLFAALLAGLATLSWRQAHSYCDAEALYRTVIERNPNSWEGHMNVGAELFKKGSLDEASSHFDRVLELYPKYPPAAERAYLNLGYVSLKRSQLSEAIAYFEKALQVDSNYAPTHSALGSALHRQGRLYESVVHYEIAVTLRPKSPLVYSDLAWMLATCADPFLRNGPRALELAQKADKLSGNANPKSLRSLAAAYAENGRFSEASATARRALQLTLHDQAPSPFSDALRDEIKRYERGEPYHEVAN